jgi:hypothetical protein
VSYRSAQLTYLSTLLTNRWQGMAVAERYVQVLSFFLDVQDASSYDR